MQKKKTPLPDLLWDLWCCVSVLGIWPRFIEPYLIFETNKKLPISSLHPDLEGFKILQFSDLHFHAKTPQFFLDKLTARINGLYPDLILFTGDFICKANLEAPARLQAFLSSLKAPFGCYCIFGNHDYEEYVTISKDGKYDISYNRESSFIVEGFKKLLSPSPALSGPTSRVSALSPHPELVRLLEGTPFTFLDNRAIQIKIGDATLNLCGLGDHFLNRCKPDVAFKNYQTEHPGIILSHNPDTISKLQHFPGNILLSGHTHGGQINLPFVVQKTVQLEDNSLLRGWIDTKKKPLYVNRGVGAPRPFRWFSPPELLLLTLQGSTCK